MYNTENRNSLPSLESLGTPKHMEMNKKQWEEYLTATLFFFVNLPTDSNRTIVFDGMRQYQQSHRQGDIKRSPTYKKAKANG
jgi:hypothetical protein